MSTTKLDVEAVHRTRGIAILSDGQTVPVASWYDHDGDCDAESALSCVCGPDFDGLWYAVDLRNFADAAIN